MIKIRMARGGRVHLPDFTIVASDSRRPRDGRFLQKLGKYSPLKSHDLSNVDLEGIRSWVKKGAELTDTVKSLLKKNNIKL